MRSIPAFSKKSSPGPTVSAKGGIRSGFVDHVKTTNAGKGGTALKGLAAFKKTPLSKKVSNPAHPGFKSASGKAGKSVPAFSKKKI